MVVKTLGTLFIVLICILMLPIGLGIIGGVFGIVVGVIGAVFGAFAGIIGGIFGAIFGVFGSIFHWHWPFGFFHCNFFTLTTLAVVVALIIKSQSRR
jgi:hypothetical protein